VFSGVAGSRFWGLDIFVQRHQNRTVFSDRRFIIGGENRKRSNRIVFYLDDGEVALLTEKMAAAGIRNREAYIRKMILDGYIVRLDLSDVRKMVKLLSNATSNLNQIAKRANETRSLYESDIQDLQENYEKLWGQAREILMGLAQIKR
jgi:hypothetical protein